MTAEVPPSPDERTFRSHLERAEFRRGVEDGRWRLIEIAWPYARIGVRAAPRAGSPDEFVIRFELSNYPAAAPAGTAWDEEKGAILAADKRPKAGRAERAFRADWQNHAMYLPCDRSTMPGHDSSWTTWKWDPSKDITFYLRLVHEILNEDDYTGV